MRRPLARPEKQGKKRLMKGDWVRVKVQKRSVVGRSRFAAAGWRGWGGLGSQRFFPAAGG